MCALQRWTTPENSLRPPGQLDIKKHHMLPSTSFARGVRFTKMDNPRNFCEASASFYISPPWCVLHKDGQPWKFCLRHPGMHSVPCGGELPHWYHLPEPDFFLPPGPSSNDLLQVISLSFSLSLYPFADGVEVILNLISEAIHDVWILSLLGKYS